MQHLDIFYLKIKTPGMGERYVSRASKFFGPRSYSPMTMSGFTTQNNDEFLRHPMLPELPRDTNSTLRAGTLVLNVYEKPSLDADPANRVPLQLHRLAGVGTLRIGDEFRLFSLEPGLWNERRFLSPKNRNGVLSYGDMRNEIVYRGGERGSDGQFSTVWWIPSAEKNGLAMLEGQAIDWCGAYTLFQISRQAILGVNVDELCTKTADLTDDQERWTFEKIVLSNSNVFSIETVF